MSSDTIAKGDAVSFVRYGIRHHGTVADVRDGFYYVHAGYWGVVKVLPRDITKECG